MFIIKYLFFLIAILSIAGCEQQKQQVYSVKQKVTPNPAEQVNVSYIIAGLKNKGFECNKFDNSINKPMIFCSRKKGKDIDACSDSIWIEHDGQNHIISNQQFYECDNDRKMVITRKNN